MVNGFGGSYRDGKLIRHFIKYASWLFLGCGNKDVSFVFDKVCLLLEIILHQQILYQDYCQCVCSSKIMKISKWLMFLVVLLLVLLPYSNHSTSPRGLLLFILHLFLSYNLSNFLPTIERFLTGCQASRRIVFTTGCQCMIIVVDQGACLNLKNCVAVSSITPVYLLHVVCSAYHCILFNWILSMRTQRFSPSAVLSHYRMPTELTNFSSR